MKGFSLSELLIVMALVGLFLMIGAKEWSTMEKQEKFKAYVEEIYSLIKGCRWRALQQRSYAGAVVEKQQGTYFITFYQDGNGNGIRKSEIAEGIDLRFYGPVMLTRLQDGVGPGILHERVPQIPPRNGYIQDVDDPIKFGSSDILSFSPRGDSSSGTLYLYCPAQQEMFALVLYGPTAKISLWRFRNHQWQMVEG